MTSRPLTEVDIRRQLDGTFCRVDPLYGTILRVQVECDFMPNYCKVNAQNNIDVPRRRVLPARKNPIRGRTA